MMLVADNPFEILVLCLLGLFFICFGSHFISNRKKTEFMFFKHENLVAGILGILVGFYFLLMFIFGVKLTIYL